MTKHQSASNSQAQNPESKLFKYAPSNITFFKELVNAAPDAFVVVDANGKIILINKQTERLFGYEEAELIGKSIEHLMPTRFRQRHVNNRTSYTSNPKTRPMGEALSLFARRKNDSEFPVEISLSPVGDGDGQYVAAIIRDITARKDIEMQLVSRAEELERLNKLMVGRELRMSELKKRIAALEKRIPGLYTETPGNDEVSEYKEEIGDEDNTAVGISDNQTDSTQQGKIFGNTKAAVINLLEDLSEEKRKLTAETNRVQALFNSLGDGLIVVDEYGYITRTNPATEKILNISSDTIIGKWYPEAIKLFSKNGRLAKIHKRPVMESINSGKVTHSRDFYLRGKDGKLMPVALTASPFLIDGRPAGVVEIFRDITEERELEHAKDEFVSLASHQLRTPATAVKQFLGMLQEGYIGALTDEQLEYVSTAYENNERQIKVIDDLLNVSRLNLGRLKPNYETTDINKFLKDIVGIMRPRFKERGQEILLDSDDGVVIDIDRSLIRMVFENILDNAGKYTPDGGEIHVTTSAPTKSTVRIAVKDIGVGIEPRDMSKLFKKFSRISNTLSVHRGGSGIGLYVASELVKLHGGKITVDSEVGTGSTFTIELKRRRTNDKNTRR